MVLLISLVTLAGYESLSYIAGLYQLSFFIEIALALYLYLFLSVSTFFDLRLKPAGSFARSSDYYHYSKQPILKWTRIFSRALHMRFRYLGSWQHFRHFQNYLILPSLLYWAVVMLLFLRPFTDFSKQVLAVVGTIFVAGVIWHLKTVFINYRASSAFLHEAMFVTAVATAFLLFAGALGIVWYFGLPSYVFVGSVVVFSFLIMYQSLFRESLVNPYDLLLVVLGCLMVGFIAMLVAKYWTVNYYSAGLLLADVIYLYWGLVLHAIRGRLKPLTVFEHVIVFLFILFFVLATTNFQARIG